MSDIGNLVYQLVTETEMDSELFGFQTVVRCSWGSSLLQPIERVIPCPLLNPMEIGEIEAMIHVPSKLPNILLIEESITEIEEVC